MTPLTESIKECTGLRVVEKVRIRPQQSSTMTQQQEHLLTGRDGDELKKELSSD